MTFKLKDPGSAITHFIGMIMALLATIPLLVKAAREPDWLHLDRIVGVCAEYVSFIYRKYHLPFTGYQCEGKSAASESGSYDDLRSDRRKLHTDLSDCTERSHRQTVMYSGMERGTGWYHRESLLDHLPEVVFFCDLHRHGMAVCAGIFPDFSRTVQTGIRMASRRRYYLHDRRYYLCTESTYF